MKPALATALAAALLLLAGTAAAQSHDHSAMKPTAMAMKPTGMMRMEGPKIDVPVALKEAKVVFRLDRVAPGGDNSFALQQIDMLAERFKQMGTNARIVAVFNGDGGFMLLNDGAYDNAMKTQGGNPYKAMLDRLLAQGVQVEECGMTLMREKWSNAQLLPGVKVNAGANLRIIDLAQQGYTVLPL